MATDAQAFILEALALGASPEEAAAAAGVELSAYYAWLRIGGLEPGGSLSEFRNSAKAAEERGRLFRERIEAQRAVLAKYDEARRILAGKALRYRETRHLRDAGDQLALLR